MQNYSKSLTDWLSRAHEVWQKQRKEALETDQTIHYMLEEKAAPPLRTLSKLSQSIFICLEEKIPPLKAIFHLLTSIKGKPRKDCFQVTKLRPRTQPKNIWENKNKPAPNNIKFTIWILITNFQTWEEENMTHDEEKNKSVGAEWEMTQMIKLVEKSQTPHVLTVTEGSEHNEDTNWCKNISVCF